MWSANTFVDLIGGKVVAASDKNLSELVPALDAYPLCTTDIDRLAKLQFIRARCVRYMSAMWGKGKKSITYLYVMVLVRQANKLMTSVRARANWSRTKARLHARHVAVQKNIAVVQKFTSMLVRPTVNGVRGQRLAEENWREVFDPQHRAGWTTKKYYDAWLSKITEKRPDGSPNPDYDPACVETFFEYLDKIQDANIYGTPYCESEAARETFEVLIAGRSLLHRHPPASSSRKFDTTNHIVTSVPFCDLMAKKKNVPGANYLLSGLGRGIWVMNAEKRIFSSSAIIIENNAFVCRLHHSTFLDGGPIVCGGEWQVENGRLTVISPTSGHYRPTFVQLVNAIRIMKEKGIDMSEVAVEWPIAAEKSLQWFNAEDFLKPGLKAVWLGWPRMIGAAGIPLRRVKMDSPKQYIDPPDLRLDKNGQPIVPAARPKFNAKMVMPVQPPLNRVPTPKAPYVAAAAAGNPLYVAAPNAAAAANPAYVQLNGQAVPQAMYVQLNNPAAPISVEEAAMHPNYAPLIVPM